MKNTIAILALAATLFASAASYAHGDHAPMPVISERAVLEQSMKDVAIIVDKKEQVEGETLDASWREVKAPVVTDKGEGYYVVGFNHPQQAKTLYLLMADTGEYYSANFTGKFSGVAAK